MSVKVAIVTGSNKGIGLAIVRALLCKFDGDVYLTSRSEEHGLEAVKELTAEGMKNVKYHQLDIDNVDSIEKLKNDIVTKYGGIDILINNAGIAFKVADTTPFGTQVAVTMKTNYFGTLQVSKILLPCMNKQSRVVNVSSMASHYALTKCSPELRKIFCSDTITEEELTAKMNEFVAAAQDESYADKGWPGTAYGVSKIGVTVLSRIQARSMREQGKSDILVNACCPGSVRTDMAGPGAPKSPDEGAETPVYLALLPVGTVTPHGELVSDKAVQKWE